MKRLNITIPDAMAKRLREIRSGTGRLNASAVCARALEAELERIERLDRIAASIDESDRGEARS